MLSRREALFLISGGGVLPGGGLFDWVDLGLKRDRSKPGLDFDVARFRPKGGRTYCVASTGDDSHSGASFAAPFRTLRRALGQPDAAAIVVDEAGGPLIGADGWRGATPAGANLVLTTRNGGKATLIGGDPAPDWAPYSGRIHKRDTPFAGRTVLVIDLAVTDKYGFASVYPPAPSLEAMTEGSCFADPQSRALYCWAEGGRSLAGDTRLIVSDPQPNGRWEPASGGLLYIENFRFIGGGRAFRALNHSPSIRATLCFDHCDFWGSTNSNLVAIQGGVDAYLQDCTGFGGNKDGFNYHGDTAGGQSVRAVEIRCTIGRNGYDNSGTNNASTAHERCKVISIDGTYHTAQNRTIHDIGDATRWMVGCRIGAPIVPDRRVSGSTTVRVDDHAKIWLDSCVLQHNSAGYADLYAHGDGGIWYANTDISKLLLRGNVSPADHP